MLGQMKDGDLVLIYGAVKELTEQNLRAQALGFLEVQLDPCRDKARMSEASYKWKVDHGFQERWKFGLKVRRAWRIRNRVGIASIAPKAYESRHRFTRTTMAILLETDERERALSHPVRQVNVFGEPEIADADLSKGTMESVLKPSKGFPPALGSRSSNYVDGENLVYLMILTTRADALFPKSAVGFGHALAKVGRTNDSARRLKEVNCGFPEKASVRWEMIQLQKYPDVATAHSVEDAIKGVFARKFTSQGNEFFTGDRKQLVEIFQAHGVETAPKILGAPGKAKGL